jgi:hypothetical protein
MLPDCRFLFIGFRSFIPRKFVTDPDEILHHRLENVPDLLMILVVLRVHGIELAGC